MDQMKAILKNRDACCSWSSGSMVSFARTGLISDSLFSAAYCSQAFLLELRYSFMDRVILHDIPLDFCKESCGWRNGEVRSGR
jgi:hypothetical protein